MSCITHQIKSFRGAGCGTEGFAPAHCCFLNIHQEERKNDMKMKIQEVSLKKQVTITVPSTLH